ncbi:hypothetical protein EHF33_15275 [Deinococcus psychrotolerans]|uniref:Uncharacterized protein n=1 Tax=Deinococcus psychrotolerans TaxID=2489213 RepID=A0A3G8YR93_9DEIO|nr:hypothetical protein [Deinococcus psychrotolerans]AZI44251.1 hypothetical protein EHF33_15275 [Deinococcus psychrotolerans]
MKDLVSLGVRVDHVICPDWPCAACFDPYNTFYASAFNAQQDGRESLDVAPQVSGGTFHVSVRFQDVDTERGFDVVVTPLPSEYRSAEQLGQEVAEGVKRERMYGQLPATHEQGGFRRIVV